MLTVFQNLFRIADRIALYLSLLLLSFLYFWGKLSSLPLTLCFSFLLSIGLFLGLSQLLKKHNSGKSKQWEKNRLALSSMPEKEAEEILLRALKEKYADLEGASVQIVLQPEKVTPNDIYRICLHLEDSPCVIVSLNGFSQEAASYAKGLSPAVALVSADRLPFGALPTVEKTQRKKTILFSYFHPIQGFILGGILLCLFLLADRFSFLFAGLFLTFLSLLLKGRDAKKPSLFDS